MTITTNNVVKARGLLVRWTYFGADDVHHARLGQHFQKLCRLGLPSSSRLGWVSQLEQGHLFQLLEEAKLMVRFVLYGPENEQQLLLGTLLPPVQP